MPNYRIGTSDPAVTRDPGAGVWNSEPTTVEMIAAEQGIIKILGAAYVAVGDDAVKHMRHYLRNSGSDYTIDLRGLLNDVTDEKENYNRELSEAKRFVENSGRTGRFEITSGSTRPGYIRQSENRNWYFAVGGYSSWGKGAANVTADAQGRKSYSLEFEYKFFDRYNWDGGKSVTLFGVTITDEFMARFHREGLAKEFDMYGSYKKTVTWGHPTSVPAAGGSGGRGGR
ncbi:MAG TPA: hypothetical protein VK308_08500 [Pyrinomonadaceae bacterium]|nr:hypothetical protein [Pyrinomonadaceae bacterium]